jgi:hypothetical protein
LQKAVRMACGSWECLPYHIDAWKTREAEDVGGGQRKAGQVMQITCNLQLTSKVAAELEVVPSRGMGESALWNCILLLACRFNNGRVNYGRGLSLLL